MADRDLVRAVVGQIEYWWHGGFRRRIVGLTDDEYLWEPAPDCWTLHPTDDGKVLYDHEWPPPHPSPVTTIAWRLCHIGVGCLANRTSRLYPAQAPAPLDQRMWEGPVPFPLSAADALDFLDKWWAAWTGSSPPARTACGSRSATASGTFRPCSSATPTPSSDSSCMSTVS